MCWVCDSNTKAGIKLLGTKLITFKTRHQTTACKCWKETFPSDPSQLFHHAPGRGSVPPPCLAKEVGGCGTGGTGLFARLVVVLVLRPVGFIATPSFLSQVTVSTCLLHIAADAANTKSLVGAHADAVSKFSVRADVPRIDQSFAMQNWLFALYIFGVVNTCTFLSNLVSAASGAAVLFCTGLFICSVSFLTCTVPSLFYA